MQHNLIIKCGRIIDPSHKLDMVGDILIRNKKISEIKNEIANPPDNKTNIIDAKGCIVCPGFIDLHCHLREPGFEDKETISTGTRAAAKGGYTTICCMPNTNPPIDNEATLDYVKRKSAIEGVIRVLPIGCITKNRQGKELTEMNLLASAGIMGFSDDGSPVMNSRIMMLAMQYSIMSGVPIIDHCEDMGLSGDGVMNEGTISTMLGLKGIPSAAEEIIVARDMALAELTGARIHIAHVSTENSIQIIRRAKDKGIKVTTEVTPHHLLLTDERVIATNRAERQILRYETNAKVNPPLRSQKDVDALIKGLSDSTIDAIATDHAPHSLVDKMCEFEKAAFGISGFETALPCLLRLVHNNSIDLYTLISSLTYRPASIIGNRFDITGSLLIDNVADITIFNPDTEWQIDSESFISKGKNTPFHGEQVRGKVIATIYEGEIVYADNNINIKANQ